MEACGGYDFALERIAAGWGGAAVGCYPSQERRAISGTLAACASAGVDWMAEAVWLWSCGRDEAPIRHQVYGVLMMEGSKIAAVAPRKWPRGLLSALVALAIEELRPRDTGDPWTDAERLRWLEAQCGLRVAKSSWSEWVRSRYGWILDAGWKWEARARAELVAGRDGESGLL